MVGCDWIFSVLNVVFFLEKDRLLSLLLVMDGGIFGSELVVISGIGFTVFEVGENSLVKGKGSFLVFGLVGVEVTSGIWLNISMF